MRFRSLLGPIPRLSGYVEVTPDKGDLKMGHVVHALYSMGHHGVLHIYHPPIIDADMSNQWQSIAWTVGYIRALLSLIQ